MVSSCCSSYLSPANSPLPVASNDEGLDEGDEGDEGNKSEKTKFSVDVDKEGYALLPVGFQDLGLKHQQRFVRAIFQKSYGESFILFLDKADSSTTGIAIVTNNPRATVPWGQMTERPDEFLDMDCIPGNVTLKDPSHLTKETVNLLHFHWKYRSNSGLPLVTFVGYKEEDFYDSISKKAATSQKHAKKNAYVEVESEEDEPTHEDDSSSSDNEEDKELQAPPSKGRQKPSKGMKNSPHKASPAFHAGSDKIIFLRTLSSHPFFQDLVNQVQQLPGNVSSFLLFNFTTYLFISKENADYIAAKQSLPKWASWTWADGYLPSEVHLEDRASIDALHLFGDYKFVSSSNGIQVALGLGLLLRECNRAQEYEADEAGDDVPLYLGQSLLGIQVGEEVNSTAAVILASVKRSLAILKAVKENNAAGDKRRAKDRADPRTENGEMKMVKTSTKATKGGELSKKEEIMKKKKAEEEKEEEEAQRKMKEQQRKDAEKKKDKQEGSSKRKKGALGGKDEGKAKAYIQSDDDEPPKKKTKVSATSPVRRSGRARKVKVRE
jgi:hypothetical protein